MPNFVFSYRNPKGYTPSDESRAAWMSWFDGMGDHLVELGRPVFERTAVGDCSPAAVAIRADSCGRICITPTAPALDTVFGLKSDSCRAIEASRYGSTLCFAASR